jgi:hypothetical protein
LKAGYNVFRPTLEQRFETLQRYHDLLTQIIEERAADPQMRDVPGGTTGLLIRKKKLVGEGENNRIGDVYEVDVELLEAMRFTLELGRRLAEMFETLSPNSDVYEA